MPQNWRRAIIAAEQLISPCSPLSQTPSIAQTSASFLFSRSSPSWTPSFLASVLQPAKLAKNFFFTPQLSIKRSQWVPTTATSAASFSSSSSSTSTVSSASSVSSQSLDARTTISAHQRPVVKPTTDGSNDDGKDDDNDDGSTTTTATTTTASTTATAAIATAASPIDLKRVLGTTDLRFLTGNIKKLVQSDHPLLNTVAQYYFGEEGKKLRPLLVLLMAQATSPSGDRSDTATRSDTTIDTRTAHATTNPDTTIPPPRRLPPAIAPAHWTLAMTTELIHTASLLHDDVIDAADTRRGQPAAQVAYGNKMAILGGDFLLSRASVALASLENTRVVSLLAEVVGELVEGEVMQMQGRDPLEALSQDSSSLVDTGRHWRLALNDDGSGDGDDGVSTESTLMNDATSISSAKNSDVSLQWHDRQFQNYLRKTYLKTASLMAKSCKAAVLLHLSASPNESRFSECAYRFGKHLGIAFQITDDVLDFTVHASDIGKPSGGSDLKLGLATAPVLYASLEHEQLIPLLEGKFLRGTMDAPDSWSVDRVLSLVHESRGVERARRLAQWHSQQAKKALEDMRALDDERRDDCKEARDVLWMLADTIIHRVK